VFGVLGPVPCADDAGCDDGNPCTVDACRGGFCDDEPVADGTACGDGDACNGIETCAGGECTRAPAPDCDDGDPCTRDVCVPPGGCAHETLCNPRPVLGRGGCRLAIAGLPAVCQDGDPACDSDGTTDRVCRFHVILCANSGPATRACRLGAPLARIRVRRRNDAGLGELVGRLATRLPATAETCVGPAAVRVAIPPGRRVVRRRVPFVIETGDHRRLGAHVVLACRAAPPGVVRRPPVPQAP